MVVGKTSLCSDLVEIFLLGSPSGSKSLRGLPYSSEPIDVCTGITGKHWVYWVLNDPR